MFHNPQWSPDGRWFLCDSNLSGRQQLWIIRRDGSEARVLTEGTEAPSGGRWARDGRSVTYTVGTPGHGQRYRLTLDEDAHPAGPPVPVADDVWTTLSPDASQALLLNRPPGGRLQIFLRTETDVRQLTEGDHSEQPSYSPDGRWILYETRPDEPPYELVMLMRADGSEQRTLSVGSDPSWSPDGTRILFKVDLDGGGHQITTMEPDGSERRAHGIGAHPEWSPDGREISWMGDAADGGTNIWVGAADGGTAVCITCALR